MDLGFQREPIYAALFSQVLATIMPGAEFNPNGALWMAAEADSVPFRTASRRYRAAGQLSNEQYPALFMVERGEVFDRHLVGGPAKVTLIAHFLIQSIAGDDANILTATEMNNLADVLQGAVEPDYVTLEQYQLGGLAFIAWITGREVQYIASGNSRWSIQDIECEIIASH